MDLVCMKPTCDYMEFSQVTYENDVRNFDGEKAVENRFAGSYNAELDNGGLVLEFEGDRAEELNKYMRSDNYSKKFNAAKKNIAKWSDRLKLSQRIQELALIRYKQLHRLSEQDQKSVSELMMTVYALYAAAFEEQEWMIEDRLINRAKVNTEDWPKVKKDLNKLVLGTFDPPKEKAIYFCTVYCKRNGIRQEEFEAIKRVADNF